MTGVLAALVPVVLLIAIAALLHRTDFLPDAAWRGMERSTYYVFFPAFLFQSLAQANFRGFHIWPLAAALLSAVAVMATILALIRRVIRLDGQTYSTAYLGAIRWNSFVAIVLLKQLYGATGITLAAVAFAAIIPVVNTLSVYVLSRHAGTDGRLSIALKAMARNPLILACLAGALWQLGGLPVPSVVGTTLTLLGRTALVLGLFTVGAALNFKHLRTNPSLLLLVGTLKLLVMPVLMATFCTLYNVQGPARTVAVVAGAVPTATNAYILTRQLGGDSALMANLISVMTVAALVTLPLAIWLLG